MTRTWKVQRGMWTVGLSLLWLGCPPASKPDPVGGGGGSAATAEIQGKDGLVGRATFTQGQGKVRVHVEVKSAPPGEHAVHVHEKGDCSDPEFKSAGGHFNPNNTPHGAPGSPSHHPGDFGNMKVGDDGSGTLDLETPDLTVSEGTVSVVGKAVIVHGGVDDLVTQPAGNAGGRIGCGVVKGP